MGSGYSNHINSTCIHEENATLSPNINGGSNFLSKAGRLSSRSLAGFCRIKANKTPSRPLLVANTAFTELSQVDTNNTTAPCAISNGHNHPISAGRPVLAHHQSMIDDRSPLIFSRNSTTTPLTRDYGANNCNNHNENIEMSLQAPRAVGEAIENSHQFKDTQLFLSNGHTIPNENGRPLKILESQLLPSLNLPGPANALPVDLALLNGKIQSRVPLPHPQVCSPTIKTPQSNNLPSGPLSPLAAVTRRDEKKRESLSSSAGNFSYNYSGLDVTPQSPPPHFTKELPFAPAESVNKRVRTLPEHRVRIKRPDADSVDITIRSFSMGIDPGPIQIDESSDSIFRFKTPYFRGNATIEIPPLDFKETWIFGWIQACYDLKFVNTYGKFGYSQWSIPGLNGTLEKAISDSDGKKFPWYGIRPDEIFVVNFPTRKTQTKEVCMSDNFYPHVTWDYPGDRFESAKLTKVLRDQRFYVWLVGMNSTLRQIYVLKAAKWRMKVTVKLDPQMPLGSRTISVSGKLTPPQIFFASDRLNGTGCTGSSNSISKFIPLQVLSPPSANTCQILTWVPKGKNSKSVVVIPAKRQLHHNERKDRD